MTAKGRREVRRSSRRRASTVAVLATVALVLSSAPAVAALPLISMTMSVSQSPAIDGTQVTWRSVVKPVRGTPTNLRLSMQSQWFSLGNGPSGGLCAPEAFCTTDGRTGNPTWVFPTLTAPVTLTYETQSNSGATTSLYIESEGTGCSGTCPATAIIKVPTTSVQVSYVPGSTPILPGTTLHVTVKGTSTAGPMDADVQGRLSAGLEAPTEIVPASAVYAPPPYNYIDDNVSLNRTATLKFDTVVTGAIGTTVSLTGSVFPVNSKYGNKSFTVKIKVGAMPPTPTPRPTSRATPKPTVGPTSAPTTAPASMPSPSPPADGESPSSIASTSSPSEDASSAPASAASVVPTASIAGPGGAQSAPGSGSPDGSASTSGAAGGVVAFVLALVVVGGIGAAVFARRR